jgi:hypothetical protein
MHGWKSPETAIASQRHVNSKFMSKPESRATLAVWFLIALPPILFYSILSSHIINIPNTDDYDALLNYANHWAGLKGTAARLLFLLSDQHNEYKLFFAHAFLWAQCALSGHIDFRWICAIGNSFVLLMAIPLWKMFLPNHGSPLVRAALFVPVSCLLFQLNYVETLDQAMQGLQNVPVLFFSLSTIYLLGSQGSRFLAALACLVLAIASSGNGLFLVPLGILFLALRRRYAALIAWLAMSGACIAAYFYDYHRLSSDGISHASLVTRALHVTLYLIAFAGSAVGVSFESAGLIPVLFKAASLVLGASIFLALALLVMRGYFKGNPAVGYCVLFLAITSLGVAGIRSQYGIFYSQSSRYRIYSDLFLIFVWFGTAEVFVVPKIGQAMQSLRRNVLYVTAVLTAAVFCGGMDAYGAARLRAQNLADLEGMAVYEHPERYPGVTGPVLPDLDVTEEHRLFRLRARAELDRSIALGLYRPPPL